MRKVGRLLSAEMKKALINCKGQFLELQPTISKGELYERLAKVFSITTQTVRNILNSFYKTGLVDSKTGNKKKGIWYSNHDFREDVAVETFKKISYGERINLNSLLIFAKQELEYTGSRTLLHRIIVNMGFKYKKLKNQKIMCEKNHIMCQKITFLRKYLQYLNSGEPVHFIFLDETWVYQNGSHIRRWVKEDDKRMVNIPIKGEGKRFIILHAGYRGGFLNGCGLFFHSSNNDKDYHKTMNGDMFKSWIEHKLIPAVKALNAKSVLIFDNAPYHSVLLEKQPTKSSSKSVFLEYLARKDPNFSESIRNLTREQLWKTIEPMLTEKQYVIDDLLHTNGIDVLRLPPYHCHYNAIELVWGFCKQEYNKNIQNSKLSLKNKPEVIWKEALSQFSVNMWNNSINHVEKIIREDWVKYMGSTTTDTIPPVIISLDNSDSEDFSLSDDSDN